MFVFIYRLTSPSGKSYIGQVVEKKGVRERWNQHVRTALHDKSKGSTALNSAILKYGRENFQIETLCKVRQNLKDIVESFCIAFFKTLVPNGYNLQTGGTFTQHSDSTREKRSNSLRTLLQNPEKRKIWSEAKKGKPQDNKNNRKHEEDRLLPKYIRRLRKESEGSEGYCIDSHPLCKCKKFTAKKFTMDEKLEMAKAYLKQLNDRIEVQRPVEAVGETT
jgi:group I intron endonuclease